MIADALCLSERTIFKTLVRIAQQSGAVIAEPSAGGTIDGAMMIAAKDVEHRRDGALLTTDTPTQGPRRAASSRGLGLARRHGAIIPQARHAAMTRVNRYPTKADRISPSGDLKLTTKPTKILLVLAALLSGCASQPYPPLPEDLEPSQAGTIGGDRVTGSDAQSRQRSLVPGFGEDLPLPPDPASLPSAKKRQLDIRLASQTFNYFEDDQLVWSGPISSGSSEHPTPKGRFSVLSKDVNKRSGSYTNYFDQPTPMPYSLQFYGPYFVHEGWLPGHAASHGCVRLRYEDARFVYSRMRVGDRVMVAD